MPVYSLEQQRIPPGSSDLSPDEVLGRGPLVRGDLEFDVQVAVSTLPPLEREVVRAMMAGGTLTAEADSRGWGWSRAKRVLDRAYAMLRSELYAYRPAEEVT